MVEFLIDQALREAIDLHNRNQLVDAKSLYNKIIEHDKISCVFSEPQFNPDIINAVAKDMNIKTGVLDPLGATLTPGKTLNFDLIRNMSKSFKGC